MPDASQTGSGSSVPSVIGPFRLEGIVGQGASGTVYRAERRENGETVALKILSPLLSGDERYVAAFLHEAELMRSLESDHCVKLLDVLEADGIIGFATQLVEGANLLAVLEAEGRLTARQSVDILHGALLGLADLHRAGIVHRDVKPANILVDRTGRSLLTDFGLARPTVGNPQSTQGTAGSPAYMSPEQTLGEATAASDVYSCGAMLFQLLTGRAPFERPSIGEVIDAHRRQPVPDPREAEPSIPAPIAELVMAALSKNPAGRPASAAEFAAALEEASRKAWGDDWRDRAGLVAAVASVLAAGGVIAGMTLAPAGTGGPTLPASSSPAASARPAARAAARSGRLARTVTSHPVLAAALVVVVVAGAIGGTLAATSSPAAKAGTNHGSNTNGNGNNGNNNGTGGGEKAAPAAQIPATAALASAVWAQRLGGYFTSGLDGVYFADAERGFVGGPGVLLATTDGGSTWQQQTLPQGVGTIATVTCTAAGPCLAGGWLQTARAALVEGTAGGAWQLVTTPTGVTAIDSLACGSSGCAAAATMNGQSVVLSGSAAGQNWTVAGIPAAVKTLDAVACAPTGSVCLAGGSLASLTTVSSQTSYHAGVLLVSDNGGGSWTTAALPTETINGTTEPAQGVLGVSCYGASLCTAADGSYVFLSTDGGHVWQKAGAPQSQPACTSNPCLGGPATLIVSVSFTSASHGVAVGHGQCGGFSFLADVGISCGGAVFVTNDGGRTWRLVINAQALTEVSCTDAAHCFAVESTNTTGSMIASSDGGASWQQVSLGGQGELAWIACGSVSWCVAAGTANDGGPLIVESHDAGAKWSPASIPLDASDAGAAYDLTCPTSKRCIVVGTAEPGAAGTLPPSGQAAFALVTDDSGNTWTLHHLPMRAEVYAIACSTGSNCVATGAGAVATTSDGGGTWTGHSVSQSPTLLSVACPAPQRCVAGGIVGFGYYSTDGGVSWKAGSFPGMSGHGTGTPLTPVVSCPSASLCLAIVTENASLSGTPSPARLISTSDAGVTWHQLAEFPASMTFVGSLGCDTSGNCLIAGGSPTGPLLYRWDGHQLQPEAAPAAAPYSWISSITCPTAGECLATTFNDAMTTIVTAKIH